MHKRFEWKGFLSVAAGIVALLILAGCGAKPLPSVVVVTADEASAMRATGKVTTLAPAGSGVEGAMELPYGAPIDPRKVKAAKNAPILVIGSPKGSAGVKVANQLTEAGYSEVHYLPGGGS